MHSVLYRDVTDNVMGIESVESGFYDRDNKQGKLFAGDVTLKIIGIYECDFEKLLVQMHTDGKLNLVDCGYKVEYEYDDGGDDSCNECETDTSEES